MRKHWLDNLRWVTVLLVLFYHVIYFYNNKGVFGGIGGFGDGPQYQDAMMYILYPWFMPMLFLLAGISARYALAKHSAGEWFKARTRKLLVPSTIGLFVFHWMVGYFNTAVADRMGVFEGIPGVVKYGIMAVSGIGPLWFIQLLWLLSLVLLAVRALDRKDRFWTWCGKAGIVTIIMLGVLFWVGEQTLVKHPRPESADGLYNLYKPFFYLIPFLLGYFVFSHDAVQKKIKQAWIPLMISAVVSGTVLLVTTFGQDNTFQFWHLYRSLSGGCQPWLHDENLYPAAALEHVPYPDGCRLYPLPSPGRTASPHPLHPLVRAGRKKVIIYDSAENKRRPAPGCRRHFLYAGSL